MPRRPKVRLLPHDPCWAPLAEAEAVRIRAVTGPVLLEVHHIGSTAIPGILAKPVLDLLGVVKSLAGLERAKAFLEALGYVWRGEYGLAGRRYLICNDPETGERRVQLHCYASGDPAIFRHLAFRDYLRSRPEAALKYEQEKVRCAQLCCDDTHAYTECKSALAKKLEDEALKFRRGTSG